MRIFEVKSGIFSKKSSVRLNNRSVWVQKHVEISHIHLSVSIFACGDVFQDTWLGFKTRIKSLWRQMRTTRIFEVKTGILSKNQGSAYKICGFGRFGCKNTWKPHTFTFLLVFSLAETFSRTHGLDLNPESCPCDFRYGRPGFSKWKPDFEQKSRIRL